MLKSGYNIKLLYLQDFLGVCKNLPQEQVSKDTCRYKFQTKNAFQVDEGFAKYDIGDKRWELLHLFLLILNPFS